MSLHPAIRPAPPGSRIGGVTVQDGPSRSEKALEACFQVGSTICSVAAEGARQIPPLVRFALWVIQEVREAFQSEVPEAPKPPKPVEKKSPHALIS